MSAKEYQPRPVEIIDTTFREGMQSPLIDDVNKYRLSSEERTELMRAQMEYGIRLFEVFSPVVNDDAGQTIELFHKTRSSFFEKTGQPVFLLAHVRCQPNDVEQALNAGVDGLNMYMGTSPDSQAYGHNKSLEEVIPMARSLLADIRRNHPEILLRFSGEDAFRTELSDLFRVYDEVVPYIDRLGTPDTVGTTKPGIVFQRVTALRKQYPSTPLEGHFHDDRGYSLINAMIAIEAGMQYMQTTILGVGERSGISSTTGLLLNIYLDNSLCLDGYQIEHSYALNALFSNILGIQVPSKEPVSLTNRTHSAGVHTSAVLKGSTAYEAHDLQRFGVTEQRLLLGPLSGYHIIQYYLTHVLNYTGVNDERAKEITATFKQRASELKDGITPTKLLEDIATHARLGRIDRPVSHEEVLYP